MSLNSCISNMTTLPSTVEEAVERLMVILGDEQRLAIAVMGENDLIDLHFSLGMAIRNAFGLHDANSKLFQACNVRDPDDASEVIIKELWKKLGTE